MQGRPRAADLHQYPEARARSVSGQFPKGYNFDGRPDWCVHEAYVRGSETSRALGVYQDNGLNSPTYWTIEPFA